MPTVSQWTARPVTLGALGSWHNGALDEANSAVLWDADNVATTKAAVPGLATVLAGLVKPGAPLVVAAQRRNFRIYRDVLVEAGYEVLSGGCRRSGADRRLVERARTLRRAGVRQFLVVSNDGDLARVAELGTLHVVTLNATQVSEKLVAAAASVWTLHYEDDAVGRVTSPPSSPAQNSTTPVEIGERECGGGR